MFFELTGGSHEQDGKKYVKGDIIETDRNLVSMFRSKFKKVSREGGIPKPDRVPNLPIKEIKPVKKVSTRLGPDVTVSFLEAKGTPFKIHKASGGKYHVVDDESNIIGGDGFTRSEVLIYLNNA